MEAELKGYFDRLDSVDIEKTLSKIEALQSHTDLIGFFRDLYNTYKESKNYEDFWTTHPSRDEFIGLLHAYTNMLSSISEAPLATFLSERKVYDDQILSLKGSRSVFAMFLQLFSLYRLEEKVDTLFEHTEIEKNVQESSEIVEELRTLRNQSKEIFKDLQDLSVKAGSEKYATIFGAEAQKNKKSAANWFWATIALVAAASVFLLFIYKDVMEKLPQGHPDPDVIFHLFLVKFLVFSFISVLVYQLMKIYKAGMHVYTLNKHRENTLLTFKTFYDSTDDPEIKKAILIQATKGVFEAGDTGYISHKESTFPMYDILKVLTKREEK